jgi:predicted DNA-binding ribbon-helix-helix protein
MKRSVAIAGHKTSISVEEPFWKGLREIAAAKKMTVPELVAFIDKDRQQENLSSHVRLFVLEFYQMLAAKSDVVERTAASSADPAPRHAQQRQADP